MVFLDHFCKVLKKAVAACFFSAMFSPPMGSALRR
jgi:hypothetical protein